MEGKKANIQLTIITNAKEERGNVDSANSGVIHISSPGSGFPAGLAQLPDTLSLREGIYTYSKPQTAWYLA